jgi:hypothetical protein
VVEHRIAESVIRVRFQACATFSVERLGSLDFLLSYSAKALEPGLYLHMVSDAPNDCGNYHYGND